MKTINFRIFITGFLPFDRFTSNPSGDAASALGQMQRLEALGPNGVPLVGLISAKVVDVVWSHDPTNPNMKGAADEIEAEIETISPHVVLSLGMAAGNFRVERRATDIDDAIADNRGFAPSTGRREFPRDPVTRKTWLPYQKIEKKWKSMGIRNVEESSNAGRFLCEDVFYRVMRIAQGHLHGTRILRAGFIHVPEPGRMAQAQINEAISAAIGVTLSDVRVDEYPRGAR